MDLKKTFLPVKQASGKILLFSTVLFHSCTKKKILSSLPLHFAVLKTKLLTFYISLELYGKIMIFLA